MSKSVITSSVRSLVPLNLLLTKLWVLSCTATYLTPGSFARRKWKNKFEISRKAAEVIVIKNVPLKISEFTSMLEKEEYCIYLQHRLICISREDLPVTPGIYAAIECSVWLVTAVGRDHANGCL